MLSAGRFWERVDLTRPRLQACQDWLRIFKDIKKEAPVPLILHGDGAPHREIDSLQVLSMRSMLAETSIAESQLLLFACPKACLGKEAMADIMKTLAWSFTAMTKGKFPAKDP